MIKHNIALIFSILFLAACSQNARSYTYFGSSGISYEHEIPGNYEFCGTDKNELGFEMYCFDNFRSMSRCLRGETTLKEYHECDFQGQITVTIQPEINAHDSIDTLESILNDQFPASSVAY